MAKHGRADGLHRRANSPYWFFKYRENGRWREKSTKEMSYKEARKFRGKFLKEEEERQLPEGELARWTFDKVAERYVEDTKLRVTPASTRKEEFFLTRPRKLFGALPCEKIRVSHLQQLQASMKAANCKNSYINLVLGATARVLRFAKVWKRLRDDVKRLPEKKGSVARVLTPEQKERLFAVASSKQPWIVAYAAGLIAANTTMRGCELKGLRWQDVDLFEQAVSVPDSKTDAGIRRIPLNRDAVAGFKILWDRASVLGTANQSSYVFPACENGRIDSTKPQTSWRTAWRKLTAEAGLAGLRFHDLRHQAITELAERGAPEQTIMALAGHVSRRMLEHYSHIRMEAKREAVQSLIAHPSVPQLNPPVSPEKPAQTRPY